MPKARTPKRRRRSLSSVEANFRQLFRVYQRSATRRRLPFELSPERFRELTKSCCLLCGAKPASKYRHDKTSRGYLRPYVYNGIDRMNNREGYVDGNCAPCCSRCNYAKGTSSLEEFLLYINRVYENVIKPALAEGWNDEETDL